MSKRKILTAVLMLCLAAFLAWRFVRPMNIFIVYERFERPMSLGIPAGLNSLSAEECVGCHAEIYAEWSESMHGQAWTDPYFQVDFVFDGSQQICLNCHVPLEDQQENLVFGFRDKERFRPILQPNPEFDPSLQKEGVTCVVCHIKDGVIIGPFETTDAPHPVKVDKSMAGGLKPCERCHVISGERWDTFYRIPPCGTVAEIGEGGQEPDCVGCHMPQTLRPVAEGGNPRKSGKHTFPGAHDPKAIAGALEVQYKQISGEDGIIGYNFQLINIGAGHYLPTGTPDRHLTLDLKLLDGQDRVIKEDRYTMKRYILWRPFIADLWDTRLAYGKPMTFEFRFGTEAGRLASVLEAVVKYHLLDEKRREKIGYENTEPISYPIYTKRISVNR